MSLPKRITHLLIRSMSFGVYPPATWCQDLTQGRRQEHIPQKEKRENRTVPFGINLCECRLEAVWNNIWDMPLWRILFPIPTYTDIEMQNLRFHPFFPPLQPATQRISLLSCQVMLFLLLIIRQNQKEVSKPPCMVTLLSTTQTGVCEIHISVGLPVTGAHQIMPLALSSV